MSRARRAAMGIGFVAAALLAVAAVVAAVEGRPYRTWPGDEVVIEVPPGASTREIAELLARAGVIRFPSLFALRARMTGKAAGLHAGEYRFDAPVSPEAVLDTLVKGQVLLHTVTVPEGLTLTETAALLAEAGWATEVDLLAAFREPGPIRDLDASAVDLEGYLFPDTYAFPRGLGADGVARAMTDRFRLALEEAGRGEGASGETGLRETVTLASLVEKETAIADERPEIAGVFRERLRRGWRLECDPTVIYALLRDGVIEARRPLSRADLLHESPYNTYRTTGLPPGPICSPGLDALRAALAPADTRALYFVAVGDGSGRHAFSSTLREHQRAVARYRQRRGR